MQVYFLIFLKRTQGGQTLEFYLIPISGQACWFYLWKVGPLNFIFILLEVWYFFFKGGFSLSFNLHLWLEREKCQPWLKKAPAKLASITGAWSLFCWALLTCLSNSTFKASLLTLKPYGFWFLTSRYWNWPRQKGCRILCFDLAGRRLEEKPRTKNTHAPNPDRWTPLQNRHQTKVHKNYFLGRVMTCFSSFSTAEALSSLSWNPFLLNFHIKDKYWN